MAPDEFFNLQAFESDSSYNHFEKINKLSKKKKSEKNNKILPKKQLFDDISDNEE